MLRVVDCERPTFTAEERRRLAMRRQHVMQRLKGMPPPTQEQLDAMIATSGVVVKRYPPGAHRGWTPSWLE